MSQHSVNEAITWTASEIVRRIASGAVSASEIVNAYLGRIENVNPRLNALVLPMFDGARSAATAIDAARARGEPLGPLAGLPFTVKEAFDVAGTPTTMGLPSRAGHPAAGDAFLVARLRQAGAILLGKTNVPQLLMGNESQNPVYGRTNNPWNPDRSPGGSSGGEAALIAAGGSALGLGSDIGGSIRLPAHACGISGLKPTSRRLTMTGHARLYPGQEAIWAQPGPLARSVADLELTMQFLSTPEQTAIDPGRPPVPYPPSAAVELNRLRIAAYTHNGVISVSPALRRAVREAAAALRDRGAEVEEWEPPEMSEAWRMYLGILMADGMAGTRRGVRRGEVDPSIRQMFFVGAFPRWLVSGISVPLFGILGQRHLAQLARSMGHVTADGYWKLVEESTRYRERFLGALRRDRFDALICPPDALAAIRHGSGRYLADALSYGALYNLLGMPAGVVAATRVRADEQSDRPLSRDLVERTALRSEHDSAGLPVGVQVAAWHWREDIVLRIMGALEEHFKATPDYPASPAI